MALRGSGVRVSLAPYIFRLILLLGLCILERKVSPLKLEKVVEVISMAPEEECEREMFVVMRWMGRELAVPLVQIEGIDVDDEIEEEIGDWHYWMEQGYELG